MKATLLLLQPRILTLRNRWRRSDAAGHRRAGGLFLLGLAFWIGIFAFFARVLAYFQAVPELGPVLAERLLGMVLLMFFSILLFSNMITALSSFYLAADLPFLRTTPVSATRLHFARFVETLWDSSWMILMFGLPVFLAYGVVYRLGPGFFLATIAVLGPFLVIPCALGVVVTMLLVRSFPARNARDVFLLLAAVSVAVLYTFLRVLQPEQLLNPERFADFLDFLAALQTPASPWLPSTWAADTLIPFFAPRHGQTPLFSYLCLASTAAAAFTACAMIADAIWATGWSRAQEGRRGRLSDRPLWDRIFVRVPWISQAARALVLKDVKNFFRDTTQWSQLILLGGLIVVYVYNFQVIPRVGAYRAQEILNQALAFLNLSLAGFVVASIAVRFLFPSISLEGKSFWLLRSAPIRLRLVWWSKFWSHVMPLLSLGLLLVWLGNRVLGVGGLVGAVSLGTLTLMTLAIAALGLCVGSIYPRFDYEHAAKIPASFGGLVYMILAISLIGVNVIVEAWPMYAMLFARLSERTLGRGEVTVIVVCGLAVAALNLVVFAVATRIGLRRLEQIEL